MLRKKRILRRKGTTFLRSDKGFAIKNTQKGRNHIATLMLYIIYKVYYRLGFSFVQFSTAGMIPRAIISSRILPKCSTEEANAAISSAVPSGAT